ncbi:hypothetical protein R1sor_012844 [Riccia sorocarpa]|uniref:Protein PHLOEM PROTEIN 2-LIKE A10 n=1 Tax=Riccia sorocarpa TaxID=122646 RepID=A0ABD3I5A7_9MARC
MCSFRRPIASPIRCFSCGIALGRSLAKHSTSAAAGLDRMGHPFAPKASEGPLPANFGLTSKVFLTEDKIGLRGAMTLPLTRRQRNALITCAVIGAGGYVSYKIYTSPSVRRKRSQVNKFFSSLTSLLDAASKGGDCAGLLWQDLHAFLLTDKDEVPQSLKQLLKVGHTREFQASVAALCRSVTQGVVSSLAKGGPPAGALYDGSDFGSALYEELSHRKEGLRKTGKSGADLGFRESRKERRLRLSGETDYKDALEEEDVKRADRTDSTVLKIDAEEEDEEVAKYSQWMTSRTYYRDRSGGDGAGESGKGKGRTQGERRIRGDSKEGLPERLVGKLFSESGKGFASVVVASAARSLVLAVLESTQENQRKSQGWSTTDWEPEFSKEKAFCEKGVANGGITPDSPKKTGLNASGTSWPESLIELAASEKGKALVADCIESFVGTAVSVYLTKTRDVNFYDDMISSVVKPTHKAPVKELLTSVCNGAVETFVRTSYDVMSAGSSAPSQTATESSVLSLDKTSYFSDSSYPQGDEKRGKDDGVIGSSVPCTPEKAEEESPSLSGLSRGGSISFDQTPQVEKVLRLAPEKLQELMLLPSSDQERANNKAAGSSKTWVRDIARTLAEPSNRGLVLDVAGTVTHEAVRSAIEVVTEKVTNPFRSKDPAQDEESSTSTIVKFVTKTGDLAAATASKAMVVMTMCLAVCLHTLVGPSKY